VSTHTVVTAVAAFGVTALTTPICIVVARRTGVLDRSGPLKPQAQPVPYLGGLAVFAGLVVGVASDRATLLIPLAIALGVGLLDDRFDLPPSLRLLAQVAVGAGIAATEPVHLPGWLGAPLIVAMTVVVINGTNLLDGLDLLAGGVGAVAAIGFAVLTHGTGRLVAVALAAGLAAFLCYNRPPARIYLGDGGSYLVGASLCVLVARGWAPGVGGAVGVASLALVAVPVGELACALIRRSRGGRPLTGGDRGHPYDRLVDRGWPRPAASGAYIGAELVAVVLGVAAAHAALGVAVVVDVAVGAGVLSAGAVAGGMTTTDGVRP
jgi:UDP-GlcNAc:undecaprenyl-phosphate/decaprenyl-phosphate GlcNAc-1-phosphate transferase